MSKIHAKLGAGSSRHAGKLFAFSRRACRIGVGADAARRGASRTMFIGRLAAEHVRINCQKRREEITELDFRWQKLGAMDDARRIIDQPRADPKVIMFKKFAYAAIFVAVTATMADAKCIREQVANDHNAWVRGAPSLFGNPLWKVAAGTAVIFCGRKTSDNRKDLIVWHWISFKSNQEPWDHDGWMSSRILEPANVDPQSNTPAVVPVPVLGVGASASESVMYGPTPKAEPNLSIPLYTPITS